MSGRGSYLLRKIGWAMITVFVVITFNFVLFRVLPGDPAKSGPARPAPQPGGGRRRCGSASASTSRSSWISTARIRSTRQYVAYLRALSAR